MHTAPDARPRGVVAAPSRRWRRGNGVVRTPPSGRRHRRVAALVVVVLIALPIWSFGRAVFVSNGDPFSANATEWARDHGLGWLVDRTEHL